MSEAEKKSKQNKVVKKICTPPRMSRISEESTESSFQKSVEANTNDVSEKQLFTTSSMVEMIKNVMEREETAFKEMTETFEKYKQAHNDNMAALIKLLESSTDPDNKENIQQINLTLKQAKSPAVVKNENLRILTLKKNLKESNTEQFQSPRTRNALSLYNSTRLKCPILETPKLRKEADEKFVKSAAKELSEALMTQCLLLQGTPKRK